MQVRQKQEELDKEVTETQAKQIELEETAEEFKREHAERHELYERLQETFRACKKLDQEVTEASEEKDRFRIRNKQENLGQRVKNLQNLQAEDSE